jgi:hypothetical protein
MFNRNSHGCARFPDRFTTSCYPYPSRATVVISSMSLQERGNFAMKRFVAPCALAIAMAVSVTACTDPYDPGQRAAGGALIGAGTGAAIGGIAGGGRGALAGGLVGGAVGAVGGAATTPQRPPPPAYQPAYYPPPPPPPSSPY